MKFPTMWYVGPAKPQISLPYTQSDQSLCLLLEYSMTVKLLTEHHLEFLEHSKITNTQNYRRK